jgi:hypothetical protein
MNSGCFCTGDGRQRGKRPARLVAEIMSQTGTFSVKHWPGNTRSVTSLLRQMHLSGRLRLVCPGTIGCHGIPALYEVNNT